MFCLVLESQFSFGGGDRYYGSSTAPDPATFRAVGGKITGTIADLLKEYDPELERTQLFVFLASWRWNQLALPGKRYAVTRELHRLPTIRSKEGLALLNDRAR